jgi:hypothetical protein
MLKQILQGATIHNVPQNVEAMFVECEHEHMVA